MIKWSGVMELSSQRTYIVVESSRSKQQTLPLDSFVISPPVFTLRIHCSNSHSYDEAQGVGHTVW